MSVFNICEYGAVGDGSTNDAASIQKAVDACAKAGGGQVLLPSGKIYYSGSIVLKSHINFHVERGACLKASGQIADYIIPERPDKDSDRRSCGGRPNYAFIYAKGAHDLSITGFGSIDGNAPAFAGETTQYHITGLTFSRPAMVFFEDCRHITVTEITLKNSHFWTLHPAGCDDVLISNIRILNDLRMANSDGIDSDHCRNVRITGCHIETADDCIVLKNTKDLESYGPTENVVISGCTLVSTSAAIKIGTESVSDFRNIIVDSCAISRSNRGLSIQLRDGGNVENVRYSNITVETRRFQENWWGTGEPIYVTAFDRNKNTRSGKVKNIYFHNISCSGENGAYISGTEDNLLEEIVLDNVRLEIHKWTKWPGGVHDRRPCADDEIVYQENAGIFCAHTKNVTLRSIKVVWGENPPNYYGSAIEAKNVSELQIDDFKGKGAHSNKKDILINGLHRSN